MKEDRAFVRGVFKIGAVASITTFIAEVTDIDDKVVKYILLFAMAVVLIETLVEMYRERKERQDDKKGSVSNQDIIFDRPVDLRYVSSEGTTGKLKTQISIDCSFVVPKKTLKQE